MRERKTNKSLEPVYLLYIQREREREREREWEIFSQLLEQVQPRTSNELTYFYFSSVFPFLSELIIPLETLIFVYIKKERKKKENPLFSECFRWPSISYDSYFQYKTILLWRNILLFFTYNYFIFLCQKGKVFQIGKTAVESLPSLSMSCYSQDGGFSFISQMSDAYQRKSIF
jgi:hypothetical protein